MSTMSAEPKTTSCPECGNKEFFPESKDWLAEGYRVCTKCKQEWYIDIDYALEAIAALNPHQPQSIAQAALKGE